MPPRSAPDPAGGAGDEGAGEKARFSRGQGEKPGCLFQAFPFLVHVKAILPVRCVKHNLCWYMVRRFFPAVVSSPCQGDFHGRLCETEPLAHVKAILPGRCLRHNLWTSKSWAAGALAPSKGEGSKHRISSPPRFGIGIFRCTTDLLFGPGGHFRCPEAPGFGVLYGRPDPSVRHPASWGVSKPGCLKALNQSNWSLWVQATNRSSHRNRAVPNSGQVFPERVGKSELRFLCVCVCVCVCVFFGGLNLFLLVFELCFRFVLGLALVSAVFELCFCFAFCLFSFCFLVLR